MKHGAIIALSVVPTLALSATLCAELVATPGGQPPAAVRRVAGCYQLTVGAWSGRLPAAGLPAAQRPPAWFALGTVRLAPPFDARFAVSPAALDPPTGMPAGWAPVGVDSVAIVWPTGAVGVALRVAVRGDSLIGIARTFDDAHPAGEPPDPEARVAAVRVPCRPELRTPAGKGGIAPGAAQGIIVSP